jgi:hypothetical protein
VTAVQVIFSIPRDQLVSYTVLSLSAHGVVVVVLLGAQQLCYLFCMCVIGGDIHLSLSLCFRRDRNVS